MSSLVEFLVEQLLSVRYGQDGSRTVQDSSVYSIGLEGLGGFLVLGALLETLIEDNLFT
jgi:hypothetical protein